jgi:hypothetical protein
MNICPILLFKEFFMWFLMVPPIDNYFPKNGAHLIMKNDV